jgi:hypothetical protein
MVFHKIKYPIMKTFIHTSMIIYYYYSMNYNNFPSTFAGYHVILSYTTFLFLYNIWNPPPGQYETGPVSCDKKFSYDMVSDNIQETNSILTNEMNNIAGDYILVKKINNKNQTNRNVLVVEFRWTTGTRRSMNKM